MSKASPSISRNVQQAERGARNVATGRWMAVLARCGYAAKGVVYLLIGGIAAKVAVGAGGAVTDQKGALQTILEQPYGLGRILLGVVTIGLFGFALWCFLQALFDTEGKGTTAKGLIARIGYAAVGITYAALAYGAFQLVMGSGSGGKGASFLELRTQFLNQLYALAVSPIVVAAVRRRLEQLVETIERSITELDTEILELVKVKQEVSAEQPREETDAAEREVNTQWKAAIALLLTIPGIGLMTACWLVVATLNFTLCQSAQAAVHYVGLAPMIRSSGASVRGRAQIGHSGHARARTQLYMATLAAARFNPAIKPYYERLRTAGKPMKVARCACARKLLHIAYAVVTQERAFDPNYQSATRGEVARA